MTRDEAVRTLQAYFRSLGLDSSGLNENDLGGASILESQIYFEYQRTKQTLKCSALIYKFHECPKPGVLEAFKAEFERAGPEGAKFDYEPENRGIYLSRIYGEAVSEEQFASDLRKLMNASEVYGHQLLDRVATKVFSQKK